MNSNVQKPDTLWPFIVLFLSISISVIVAGILYFKFQKRAILSAKQQELSAISDLKIRQITQWRMERMGDGKFLGEEVLLVSKLSEYLQDTGKLKLRNSIILSLKSLIENYDYKSILLLDIKGNVKLSFPVQDTLAGNYLKPLIPGIISRRRVILTDLHRANIVSFVHLDLVIPLIDHSLNDSTVLGLIAIRIDPQKVLYPLIQSWPTPSKSAETLLIRKEGDEIVYLNRLRHANNTELTLRNSASLEKLPAAMATRGIEGTVEGIDYRNVPVVAVMKKIPGSPWYLVAKIDRDEALSDIYYQRSMVITILILFISLIGLFLGFLWWNERARFYRGKYETELSRLALIKHFDYILKFANDIILLFDKELKIVEANDRALETYLYTRDELIGMNLEKIKAPETLPLLSERIKMIDTDKSATFETIHKRKDDTTFPVEISSRVIDIEGSKYYQSIGRDITERKSIEDTLKESEEKFRKIFEESPFSMLMTGKDFGILKANNSFCQMTGYIEEDLKSFTFRTFTHPDYIEGDEISLMRLIAGEIPLYHTEKRYIRKDGSVIWGSTTVSIIRNNTGEAQYFLVMVENITARKRTESELIGAKERAEESDRLKTAFLHNVSHEIRTPMNAILGFSTLLNEPGLSESEHNQYVNIIFQSSNQLLSIINDIVDIANVESGQVKLNFREMNLNSSLRSLVEQFRYNENEYDIAINFSPGLKDEESTIVTDTTKLIQILSNLIGNAKKFTRKGSIDIRYTLNNALLEFSVRDTGIGIRPEHIDKIFNRFSQVDATDSRQYSGTGLGLSICKAYVELMGGYIGVESEPGKGTHFVFTLPYLTANKQS